MVQMTPFWDLWCSAANVRMWYLIDPRNPHLEETIKLLGETMERVQGRCEISGNPCGTDCHEVNHPCLCEPCKHWSAIIFVGGLSGSEEK